MVAIVSDLVHFISFIVQFFYLLPHLSQNRLIKIQPRVEIRRTALMSMNPDHQRLSIVKKSNNRTTADSFQRFYIIVNYKILYLKHLALLTKTIWLLNFNRHILLNLLNSRITNNTHLRPLSQPLKIPNLGKR